MARHLGICPGQRVQTKQCRPKHQGVQRRLSQPLFHEVCSHQLFCYGHVRLRRGSRGMETGDKSGVLRAGQALLDHGQRAPDCPVPVLH